MGVIKMNAVPNFKPVVDKRAKVIDLSEVMKVMDKKKEPKLNKDGTINKVRPNKTAGVSSEVYPFVSKEEIEAMISLFDKRIVEAPDENKKQIASRNKMLFLVGINLGVRASDLCGLKYNFFFKEDGTFKDGYKLQPKKTKKTGKFVPLYFNDTIKKAITEYLNNYPMESMDEYLFKSRKGNGHITEIALGKIIKDAAKEIGIERNICSHSLRKTFGYFIYHKAEDKNNALIILQKIFNHSSPAMTSKYIGLMDEEIEDVFNTLNLGLDFFDN